MNWETVLTTLWNKISKPFTNILIGLAFFSAAPENVSWFGWIFTAIGVGSFIDKQSQVIHEKWINLKIKKEIKIEIENATDEESGILKLMVQHNKRIMRRSDFENIFIDHIKRNRNQFPSEIYGIFESLQDKNLIYYLPNEFRGQFEIQIQYQVWDIIKNIYKDEFNIAHKNSK
jgi:hypothetical protein